jgi:hypothetical protein
VRPSDGGLVGHVPQPGRVDLEVVAAVVHQLAGAQLEDDLHRPAQHRLPGLDRRPPVADDVLVEVLAAAETEGEPALGQDLQGRGLLCDHGRMGVGYPSLRRRNVGAMNPADVLIDLFERVLENGVAAVDGLDEEQLAHRPTPHANSIAWLVWHTARVQDAQVAHLAGTEQVWLTEGWAEHFALPIDPHDHGYGHTSEQVGQVRAGADLLAGYLRAAHDATLAYLRGLPGADLDEVVDRSWDPPVTRGVRLVSIAADDVQHVGQAAYVRGLLGG